MRMGTKAPVGGFTVTKRDAEPLESATLVAFTVAICCTATFAGAVYSPVDEMAPEPVGVTDQLTAVFGFPRTVAVNCWDCPGLNVTGAWSMVTSVVADV